MRVCPIEVSEGCRNLTLQSFIMNLRPTLQRVGRETGEGNLEDIVVRVVHWLPDPAHGSI